MPNDTPSLKEIIGSAVDTIKPKFTDIDLETLQAFLSSANGFNKPVKLSGIRGGDNATGASSGIIIFTAEVDGEASDYVLRYAPMNNEGRIFFDYSIDKQYQLQRRLSQAGLPVAPGLCIDIDGSYLGLPGFVMPFVKGEVPNGSPYTAGILVEASAQERETLLQEVMKVQGRIHAVDWQRLELDRYVKAEEGRTALERYLNWYWKTAKWVQPDELDRLGKVLKWLIDNQPTYHNDDLCLAHGDPGLGNYMFDGLSLVSVLDWELAGIIHPSYDIAVNCLMNSFYKAVASKDVAAIIPSDEEWIKRYESQTGNTVKDFDYFKQYAAFGSLVVSLSISRNVPEETKAGFAIMREPFWEAAESGYN